MQKSKFVLLTFSVILLSNNFAHAAPTLSCSGNNELTITKDTNITGDLAFTGRLTSGIVPLERLDFGTANECFNNQFVSKIDGNGVTCTAIKDLSRWALVGNDISYTKGNVGIGTSDMSGMRLRVEGNTDLAGNVYINKNGNGALITRHIDGKKPDSSDYDNLYLQYSTGKNVNIGGGATSHLTVHGNIIAQGFCFGGDCRTNMASFKGDKGDTGKDGKDGDKGKDGKDGKDGTNGVGTQGPAGPQGPSTRFIARHSQTTSLPSVPAGWTKLWDGYSYVIGAGAGGYSGGQDLGSPGSCLTEFRTMPFMECNVYGCDYYTGEDFSFWLSTLTADEGPVSVADSVSRVSRCSVFEVNKPILVRHSQTTSLPSAPAGWTKLWDGYSYVIGAGAGGYNGGQDLGSPGSCLTEFRTMPFVECNVYGCDYYTGEDFSFWLSTLTADEGPVSVADSVSRASRCTVFTK